MTEEYFVEEDTTPEKLEVAVQVPDALKELITEFPEPLTAEEQKGLETEALYRYVMAMTMRIDDENLLMLSVAEDGLRTEVAMVSGGLSIGSGTTDRMGVQYPCHFGQALSIVVASADVDRFVNHIEIPGRDIPVGSPDFKGHDVLLHSDHFCLNFTELIDFSVGHVMQFPKVMLLGPVLLVTDAIEPVDLDDYTCAEGSTILEVINTAMEEMAEAQGKGEESLIITP